MYRIITEELTAGDKAVTSLYLETIFNACAKAHKKCCYGIKEGTAKRKDVLIFDECKVALKYSMKGYSNYIIWIQGIVPEEAVMMGYSKWRYYVHSAIERLVLRKCKFVIFCSEEMKRHYEVKYKMNFHGNSFVMPCFNETQIDEKSFLNEKKYKENNFVYIGGLQPWQCFNETAYVYKKIEEKMGGKTKLYIYTADQIGAKAIVESLKIQNYFIGYKEKDELGECLRNMKYGFVLRKNVEVNRVATPTKLSNYISHGIIPIYSDCLKSFDEYNKKTKGPAVICDVENLDTGIENIVDSCQSKVEKNAMKKWADKTYGSYYNKNLYTEKLSRIIETF